ncbi:ATP-binding protein [Mucilaginibacter sp.]|uniref:tetratricopeptide repeat-containing sensor histidine kinase n=1 Tax=Mucilaginibacter sp. TaxID=1882438 RepID=UPI003267E37E
MHKRLLLPFFILLTSVCLGQADKRMEALNQKKKLCETIIATSTGKSETFDELIKTGEDGLKLTKPGDHQFRFFFNQSIGVGYYYKQNFNEAKNHFELAVSESVAAGFIEQSLKPLGNLVFIYHYLGMRDKADNAAQKLKQIAESTDTLKTKGDIYYNLGMYNLQQKFYYGIALNNFLKSIALSKAFADTTHIIKKKLDQGAKLAMVAEIYLYLKQPEKALQYLDEARPTLGLSVIYDVGAYGKFVRTYSQLNDQKNALKYYNKLHEAAGKTPGKWSELVSSNLEMANLALKHKDFKQAKTFIDKADKQAKLGTNNDMIVSAVSILYGDYYMQLDNILTAEKYYKMAEYGSMHFNKEQYADLLQKLTDAEMKVGKAADAASYFKKYITIADSLNQRKISLNLAEMEAVFQNGMKQKQIGSLNKENNIKSLQLKQEITTRWMLVGLATLLLIALTAIYLNYRNKQKANMLLDQKNGELDTLNAQLTGANQTKAKLFSIISHDLRSPISQLFTFLKLQQVTPDAITPDQKDLHQKKLMQSSSDLLETMEDLLLWSKSQMDNFELDIDNIDINDLFNEATLMVKGQAADKQLEIKKGDIGFLQLKSDQNLLVIILRNLLQNAINNAYTNTVIILTAGKTVNGKFYLSVTNQADVIPIERIEELINTVNIKSKSSGYGLLIVKELLQKLNANLNISSTAEGTIMQIVFA